MDKHEIPERDGGVYVIARSPAGVLGVTYRYPDGGEIPSTPDHVDWMPEVFRLAARVRELEESSAHNAELAEKALRDRAGEAARIRKELLEAIHAEAGTYFNGGEIALRAVSAATLVAALDRIIPEEP